MASVFAIIGRIELTNETFAKFAPSTSGELVTHHAPAHRCYLHSVGMSVYNLENAALCAVVAVLLCTGSGYAASSARCMICCAIGSARALQVNMQPYVQPPKCAWFQSYPPSSIPTSSISDQQPGTGQLDRWGYARSRPG